jgi:hypothetical protein
MRSMSGWAALMLLTVLLHLGLGVPARALEEPAENAMASPDDVVVELYDLVTFEAGTTPDWDRVRSLFLDEAEVPGSERPPQRGIDNIQLSRRVDGWRIVSITNEIVRADGPLPPGLEE